MAEGSLQSKYGRFDVFSAGTRQSRVSDRAIQVMQEIWIDISHHRSKNLDEMSGMKFDLAVMLCDRAHQICPVVSCAKKTIHYGFPDPHLTSGSDEEFLIGYREVRNLSLRLIYRRVNRKQLYLPPEYCLEEHLPVSVRHQQF